MPAVNIRHETFDVRIDRKTKWGNPFVMGRDGDRDAVCEKYRRWLWAEIQAGRVDLNELAALRGKRLGCHCAPQRCHGDTLSAAAEWAHQTLQARKAAASSADVDPEKTEPEEIGAGEIEAEDPDSPYMEIRGCGGFRS